MLSPSELLNCFFHKKIFHLLLALPWPQTAQCWSIDCQTHPWGRISTARSLQLSLLPYCSLSGAGSLEIRSLLNFWPVTVPSMEFGACHSLTFLRCALVAAASFQDCFCFPEPWLAVWLWLWSCLLRGPLKPSLVFILMYVSRSGNTMQRGGVHHSWQPLWKMRPHCYLS